MKTPLPSITVCVCVLNGQETIQQCLRSLLTLDYPEDKLSIVVIDNGSDDKTPEIIRKFPVKVVLEPRRGRGVARNRAWKDCKTELLAFTDADCVVSPNWLQSVVSCFDNAQVGVAGGDIVTPGESELARFFELRQVVSNREFSGDYPYSPPFLATANAVFRLSAIQEVGGFCSEFRVAEDADICWRILKSGYKIKYVPGATVYHHHRTSLINMFKQAVDYGYDGVHVYLHHHPGLKYWVWWGLYYRLMISCLRLFQTPFLKDRFEKKLPWFDLVRYSGLALGRMSAALKFRKLIL